MLGHIRRSASGSALAQALTLAWIIPFSWHQHWRIAMQSEEGIHAINTAGRRCHFVSNQSVGSPPLVLPPQERRHKGP
jgi:hypothetical protein